MKGFLDYIHWWKILSYKKAHTCDLRLVWYLFHREGNILHEISTFNGWPHSANHLVQSKNVLRSLRLTVILALVFFCCWVFLTLWWKGTFLNRYLLQFHLSMSHLLLLPYMQIPHIGLILFICKNIVLTFSFFKNHMKITKMFSIVI